VLPAIVLMAIFAESAAGLFGFWPPHETDALSASTFQPDPLLKRMICDWQ